MSYWKCCYHVTWATKYRQPVITPTLEKIIFSAILEQSRHLNCRVMAVNGVPDHIHVAVEIPPTLLVSKWVGDVKAVSSREVNLSFPDADEKFQWQEGYGVHTFGYRNERHVVGYIRNQKQHHAEMTTFDIFEIYD